MVKYFCPETEPIAAPWISGVEKGTHMFTVVISFVSVNTSQEAGSQCLWAQNLMNRWQCSSHNEVPLNHKEENPMAAFCSCIGWKQPGARVDLCASMGVMFRKVKWIHGDMWSQREQVLLPRVLSMRYGVMYMKEHQAAEFRFMHTTHLTEFFLS